MYRALVLLLCLCSSTALFTQQVAWVKTFSQQNPANPGMNHVDFDLREDGTFWLATMKNRRGAWTQSVLGEVELYQMDLSGTILDSIAILGNAGVEKITSSGNESYILVEYLDSVTVAGQSFQVGLEHRQILLRLDPQGQLTLIREQEDTTTTIFANAPNEFLAVSTKGLTDPVIERVDQGGNTLAMRMLSGMGRVTGVTEGSDGAITLGGGCLDQNFSLDSVTLSSSGFYNGFVMGLDSNFMLQWGQIWEDITCNTVHLGQDAQGNTMFSELLTVAQNFGSYPFAGPNTSNHDFVLGKTDPMGACQWIREIPSDTGWSRVSPAVDQSLGVDGQGNVYFAGTFSGTIDWGNGQVTSSSTGMTDGIILSWEPSGNLRWVRNLGSDGAVIPKQIEVLGVDSILISGMVLDTTNFDSIQVNGTFGAQFIALITPPATVVGLELSFEFELWPNPLQNGSLFYRSPEAVEYLEIRDIQGREVQEYYNLPARKILNFHLKQRGLYLVQAVSGGRAVTRKVWYGE